MSALVEFERALHESSERTIVQRRVGRRSRGGPSSALSADLASNYSVYDFQTGV